MLLLAGADRLGRYPGRTAVISSDPDVVEAACRGGFAFVLAVDRAGDREPDLLDLQSAREPGAGLDGAAIRDVRPFPATRRTNDPGRAHQRREPTWKA